MIQLLFQIVVRFFFSLILFFYFEFNWSCVLWFSKCIGFNSVINKLEFLSQEEVAVVPEGIVFIYSVTELLCRE